MGSSRSKSCMGKVPHSLLDEDAVDYFVTAHKELSYGGIKIRMKDEFN